MARDGGRRATDYHGDDYERPGDVENRSDKPAYEQDGRRTGLLSLLLALLFLLLIGGLVWWYFTQRDQGDATVQEATGEYRDEVRVQGLGKTLPEHRQVVPAAPANIIITTNTSTLTGNSTITIDKDGKDYGEDKALVIGSGKVLRRDMDENAPDGIYTVNYRLCSQGRDCLTGSYQFKIDENLDKNYEDRTRDSAVTVNFENGKLNPERFIISQGTRVTWQNKEATVYRLYPGSEEVKNIFPRLTSGPISQNGTFTFVITEQGYIEYFAENGNKIEGKIIVK